MVATPGINKIYIKTLISLSLLFATQIAFAQTPSIKGKWKTADEKTGKPKGLVEIYVDNGEIKGKLIENYGDPTKINCVKCEGDKKDKPLKGLEIIWGVKSTGQGEWGGGHILDPENGKTYRVKFALLNDGKELKVRGFIGISLLGRSQVWLRAH